tara:strand:- start:14233 stop:15354 length:1122 start_codon:yes stop_codon:yes gene_type:complete
MSNGPQELTQEELNDFMREFVNNPEASEAEISARAEELANKYSNDEAGNLSFQRTPTAPVRKRAPQPLPGSGPTRPTITNSLLSGAKKALKEDLGVREGRTHSGYNQQPIIEPNPDYNVASTENVIKGQHNTIIIMGKDRPSTMEKGKGSKPNTHVGCIDIIAGLSGILAREVGPKGQRVLTNKDPQLDAARIYISQRADIDSKEYFGLAKGKVGSLTNRSAIAIKADSVRIIGREGIKLVTSTDTYNGASGMFIGDNIQGIDIIAGNNDSDLQPMVKGDDLAKVLDNLVDLITDLHGSAAFTLELLTSAVAALVPGAGAASAAKLSLLVKRLPIEIINLSIQEKNFVYHKLNYSKSNPIAAFDFRSRFNNVN